MLKPASVTSGERRRERHKTLRSAAITLFGLVENELLEEREIWADLENVARGLKWPSRRAEELLVWCRAKAAAEKPLPQRWEK